MNLVSAWVTSVWFPSFSFLFHYHVRYIYKAQDCKYCVRHFYSLHEMWRPLTPYLDKENNPRKSKRVSSPHSHHVLEDHPKIGAQRKESDLGFTSWVTLLGATRHPSRMWSSSVPWLWDVLTALTVSNREGLLSFVAEISIEKWPHWTVNKVKRKAATSANSRPHEEVWPRLPLRCT